MDAILNISNRLLNSIHFSFERSLLRDIDWTQRLIEIRGSRGVGKTTMMLQKAKELRTLGCNVVYTSLDTPYFFRESLFNFVEYFVLHGGTHLFLDEVHRYPSKAKLSDWSLEIKNIYDAFPQLQIVYSGSSILHLYKGKGDLSRRKASYLLNGLSFREFLELNDLLKTSRLSLNVLIDNHEEIARTICEKIRPLQHFKHYLKFGFYPFYSGNEDVYFQQLQEMVNQIIDADLPYLSAISTGGQEQLKRLLGAISSTVPYLPNMKKLAEQIQVTDHRTLLKYMYLLEQAQLIALLRSGAKGNKLLEKPDKIYLNNTNLIHALSYTHTDIGSERETFFINQLNQVARVKYPKTGDFTVNETFLFEIGGKSKTAKQISKSGNAYIASDDIETGFGNKIPLWLFGFLY